MNPLMDGAMGSINGMTIYAAEHLTEIVCIARSPSRAKRRWRQGKRAVSPYARVPSRKLLQVDGKLFAHPDTLRALRQMLGAASPAVSMEVRAQIRAAFPLAPSLNIT